MCGCILKKKTYMKNAVNQQDCVWRGDEYNRKCLFNKWLNLINVIQSASQYAASKQQQQRHTQCFGDLRSKRHVQVDCAISISITRQYCESRKLDMMVGLLQLVISADSEHYLHRYPSKCGAQFEDFNNRQYYQIFSEMNIFIVKLIN